MLKHFLNPPNWFTSASLFCGLYAVVLATGMNGPKDLHQAGVMILFAAVFDAMDGAVARLTKTASKFGIQLDSLCDAVSFGFAPAILLYAWGLSALGGLGLAGAFFFALCGVFRLARFNTKADGTKSAYTEGITITMAGSTVAALVMSYGSNGWAAPPAFAILALAGVLGLLMVSAVPYRSHKSLRRGPRALVGMLSMGALLTISARVNVGTAFLSVLGSYVASGPIEALIRKARRSPRPELPVEVVEPAKSQP